MRTPVFPRWQRPLACFSDHSGTCTCSPEYILYIYIIFISYISKCVPTANKWSNSLSDLTRKHHTRKHFEKKNNKFWTQVNTQKMGLSANRVFPIPIGCNWEMPTIFRRTHHILLADIYPHEISQTTRIYKCCYWGKPNNKPSRIGVYEIGYTPVTGMMHSICPFMVLYGWLLGLFMALALLHYWRKLIIYVWVVLLCFLQLPSAIQWTSMNQIADCWNKRNISNHFSQQNHISHAMNCAMNCAI